MSPNTTGGVDFTLAAAIHYVVAVAVWGALGLLVDQILPTAPWGHVVGVFAGSQIGLVLVQRRAVVPTADGSRDG